jgi:dihydrofolate reductase/thymidylate synthase
MINVIVAMSRNRGIGSLNMIPWYIPKELALFKVKTYNNILIVGRKTAETICHLENRTIICVSSQSSLPFSCDLICSSFEDALDEALEISKRENKKIFVAGGEEIYDHVFKLYEKNITLHISILNKDYECDKYFTPNLDNFVISTRRPYETFTHYVLNYTSDGELQYINLIKDVISDGEERVCRNGKTISVFSKNLKFDIRNGFPLLTTKKMFFRGIVEELLFFLKGETNTKILEEKGVNIWKGNTSREFLNSVGMTKRPEGLMGQMLGYHW